LALRLYAVYGKQPDPTVVEIARNGLANLKRKNFEVNPMKSDAQYLGKFRRFRSIYEG
jgi:hypothetical protein